MSSELTLFPAIDLKDGTCVRLIQGDMARATVISDDPAAQARDFEAAKVHGRGVRILRDPDLQTGPLCLSSQTVKPITTALDRKHDSGFGAARKAHALLVVCFCAESVSLRQDDLHTCHVTDLEGERV